MMVGNDGNAEIFKISFLLSSRTVVIIGFERTSYTTLENDTIVSVCASIMPPPDLARTVVVTLESSDGTATGKEYREHINCIAIHISLSLTISLSLSLSLSPFAAPVDYNAISVELTFDESNSRRCVAFIAFEDDVVDPDETFTVTLTSGDDVNLTPDTAIVTIVDDVRK